MEILLKNRGITDREQFLNPQKDIHVDLGNLKKPLARINKAIKNKEKIVVYGDYDADGICGTAIMWEALQSKGAIVLPFIPHREKDGYGLSVEGIDQVDATLIITVDSGIMAHDAVSYANKKGIDVIILDHHEKPKKLPKAYAIIHTTELCAAGIAYIVAKEFGSDGLELAAIATITDLIPLIGPNRSIVKFGLEALNKTTRPGLKALFDIAGIEKVGTYEVGYMIGPRLNASGRIDSALTGLRLLCTKNKEKALDYAKDLDRINRDRQTMLEEQVQHALLLSLANTQKIIVIEHESYHQGIIGLIAGKITEKYYLPSIVIAKGAEISKASARSISGFNIIEAIRETEKLLINAGGHPMAAGFTIENFQISNFKLQISKIAAEKITTEMLEKVLRVDCELDIKDATMDLFAEITQMAPFGLGNPEPVFSSVVTVQDLRTVGAEGKHLKLRLIPSEAEGSSTMDAIAFGKGELAQEIKIGDQIKIAYNLDLNTFNGRQTLQLKIKDIVLQ